MRSLAIVISLLTAGLLGALSAPALAAGGNVSPGQVGYASEPSNYNLVIENGVIGIAKVRAMFQVRNASGSLDLVIVADSTGFAELVLAMRGMSRSVVAEVQGTSLVAWLRAHPGGRMLYGHLEGSSKRVYVVPSRPEY